MSSCVNAYQAKASLSGAASRAAAVATSRSACSAENAAGVHDCGNCKNDTDTVSARLSVCVCQWRSNSHMRHTCSIKVFDLRYTCVCPHKQVAQQYSEKPCTVNRNRLHAYTAKSALAYKVCRLRVRTDMRCYSVFAPGEKLTCAAVAFAEFAAFSGIPPLRRPELCRVDSFWML